MLTPAQVRVGRLIADGLSNKVISERLGISGSTAKNHAYNINKLLCPIGSNRVQLVMALREYFEAIDNGELPVVKTVEVKAEVLDENPKPVAQPNDERSCFKAISVEIKSGAELEDAAKQIVQLARAAGCPVDSVFGGIAIFAEPGEVSGEVIKRWICAKNSPRDLHGVVPGEYEEVAT